MVRAGEEAPPECPPISRVIYLLFGTKLTQHLTWTCHWIIALCCGGITGKERWPRHRKLSELRNLWRVHVKQAFVYTKREREGDIYIFPAHLAMRTSDDIPGLQI